MLYRRRGFLAAWIAGMASGWLTTAMALRSLEDQDLARASQRARGAGGGNCRDRRVGRRPQAAAETRRYIRALSSASIAVTQNRPEYTDRNGWLHDA